MLLSALAFVFHAGLVPAVSILLRGDARWFHHLLPIGIGHVLLLWLIGARLKVPLDRHAIGTLHRAGFLHTLLGLGAAVMIVASAWAEGHTIGAPVSAALAPMGAALVPHVLGVWLAHALDLRSAAAGATVADVERKVEESLHGVLHALGRVQASADGFCTRVEGATRASADSLDRITAGMGTLRTVTREIAASATAFQRSVDEVARTTEQIHLVHRQIVELMHALLRREEKERV